MANVVGNSALAHSAVLDWSAGLGGDNRDIPLPDSIWAALILGSMGLMLLRDWCKSTDKQASRCVPLALKGVYRVVAVAFCLLLAASVSLYLFEEWYKSAFPSLQLAGLGVETVVLLSLAGLRMAALEGVFALLGFYFSQASVISVRVSAAVIPAGIWAAVCGLASFVTSALVAFSGAPADTAQLILALTIACATILACAVAPFCFGVGRPSLRVWGLGVVIIRSLQVLALLLEALGPVNDALPWITPGSSVASTWGFVVDTAFLVCMSGGFALTALLALRTDVVFLGLFHRSLEYQAAMIDGVGENPFGLTSPRLGCTQWCGALCCACGSIDAASVPYAFAYGPALSPFEGRGLRPPYVCELCFRPEASSREVLRFYAAACRERERERAAILRAGIARRRP
ncbi:hypothetical protein FNF27_05118 [Cafeteria roenbergensis]|uniref:Uncharacterized protein n=1 Tax=Cafeteria roenbergensis TaxID=33653 RepID=A0A5A8EBV2_CAFRO|nr:hypothetical protein FNF27_05118 [Cafeteria roenbergensis]